MKLKTSSVFIREMLNFKRSKIKMQTQYHYVGNNVSGRDYEIISKYNLSIDSNFVASSSK